jgi:hypothetical protein
MGGQPCSQRVLSMTRPRATHAAPAPVWPRYLETMTQTPKTTLPAKAKAATAPSTM